MQAEFFLKSLIGRGIRVLTCPDGSLVVEGHLTDSDRDKIRRLKPEILQVLGRRFDSRKFDRVRQFRYRIGDEVSTPWGTGVLYGLNPNQAIVDTGGLLVGFDFDVVNTPHQSGDSREV